MADKELLTRTVRISEEAYSVAKGVAGLKGVDIGVYVSALILPAAQRDLEAETRKRTKPK